MSNYTRCLPCELPNGRTFAALILKLWIEDSCKFIWLKTLCIHISHHFVQTFEDLQINPNQSYKYEELEYEDIVQDEVLF